MATGFVLSIIQRPEGEARHGKALVLDPVSTLDAIARRVTYILTTEAGASPESAQEVGEMLLDGDLGVFVEHTGSNLTFRIDSAENAPHTCPCEDGCDRLVLPNDHPYAHAEDAYCLGCFTWSRDVQACLPENSAHTKKVLS